MLECQMEQNWGKSSRGGNFQSNNFGGALSSPSTLLWPCVAFRFSERPFPQVHVILTSLLRLSFLVTFLGQAVCSQNKAWHVTQWARPDSESWPSAFAVAVLWGSGLPSQRALPTFLLTLF